MATDTLEIFGTEYSGVTGIKATDDNSQTKTYIRPQGNKSISENGDNIDVSTFATVSVNVSGGTSAAAKDVNFIDYDGTIVYSYTAAEFANLSALPANPVHDGLTAQGWNWSLSDAKTYVAANGGLWIGQMYVTSDGKTRIYIRLENGRLSPFLGIGLNGTATVEWGDGTPNSTVTGTSTSTVINTQHSYGAAGDYVIAISISGSMSIRGSYNGSQILWKNSSTVAENHVYRSAIQRVEIGNNVSIDEYAFYRCYGLTSIAIPSGTTMSFSDTFTYCYSLVSVTFPYGVTASSGSYPFEYCYSLVSVSLPNTMTYLPQGTFYDCFTLANITIPDSVTSLGNSAIRDCNRLSMVVIPSGVESIANYAFSSCAGLAAVHFKPTTPPTLGSAVFSSLPTDCIIYVPAGSLSAYTTATNYPSSSTYTYLEE